MKYSVSILIAVVGCVVGTYFLAQQNQTDSRPANREEVIFWHFWGGQDRDVVDNLVAKFNQSQDRYWVRAIAMPGNNLDVKIFLAITGGNPPDLVNQDDPIVADWASRGAILPIDEIAPESELRAVENSLFDSAKALGTYNQRLYAVCNGLDIRALYYNKTVLDQYNLKPPTTIEELDLIAKTIAPPEREGPRDYFGYVPDARRLWAWGYVFGGSFYDPENERATVDSASIEQAMNWMAGYSRWYGADTIAAFRQNDQSMSGKSFPLLPSADDKMVGRYVMIMDGQWRTRDIRAEIEDRKKKGVPYPEFGVCPLPYPDNGRANAGWVNGNFFVVPRGASNKQGAWEFMKFWIGEIDAEQAGEFCAAGGWIPTTQQVSQSDSFQRHLEQNPLFRPFVELAASENQFPVPVVPGGPLFKRSVEQASSQAMNKPDEYKKFLESAQQNIQRHLDRTK